MAFCDRNRDFFFNKARKISWFSLISSLVSQKRFSFTYNDAHKTHDDTYNNIRLQEAYHPWVVELGVTLKVYKAIL